MQTEGLINLDKAKNIAITSFTSFLHITGVICYI